MDNLVPQSQTNVATSNHNGTGLVLTEKHIALLKATLCKDASNEELQLYIAQCKRVGLDPLSKQIFAVRWGGDRSPLTFSISIDGLRLIAERTGKYAGQVGPFFCGEDRQWVDAWLEDTPPLACKVGVLRTDFKEPVWGVGRFKSYARFKKDGSLYETWQKMPDVMLAKCVEAQALRKAFPQELNGFYEENERLQGREEPEDPTQETEWEKKLIPNAWLPADLQNKQITFEQLAVDNTLKFISLRDGKEYKGRQLIHMWESRKDEMAKLVAARLLIMFPSQSQAPAALPAPTTDVTPPASVTA